MLPFLSVASWFLCTAGCLLAIARYFFRITATYTSRITFISNA